MTPASEPEIHDVEGGELVSVRATTADGPVAVLAFSHDSDARTRAVRRLLWLTAAAVVLLLLAAAAAEIVTRRLVRDLDETAAAADRLAEGDLSARAGGAGRLGGGPGLGGAQPACRAHRRLACGGAGDRRRPLHRLRTPLTAVRLDVEALPASERTEELDAHLDRLERTLTAVIRAARRPEREGAMPLCDAVEVVREEVDF